MEKACRDHKPFSLDFNNAGFFKHSRKELWWIGPENDSTGLSKLYKIRQELTENLDKANINFDKRPYRPHITLGREIKTQGPVKLPAEKITVPVNRISLMRSENIDRLLVHTKIFTVPAE